MEVRHALQLLAIAGTTAKRVQRRAGLLGKPIEFELFSPLTQPEFLRVELAGGSAVEVHRLFGLSAIRHSTVVLYCLNDPAALAVLRFLFVEILVCHTPRKVLFKFRPDVSEDHRAMFVEELKGLKTLPCVQDHRLIVGGPSITDPIERSKGFNYALLSFHEDRPALEEYQASDEHHRVTSTYLWPFKDDVTRFDFEVDTEDEYMCRFMPQMGLLKGVMTPARLESDGETPHNL